MYKNDKDKVLRCYLQIQKPIVKILIQICCSLYEWNVATGERMHEVKIVIFGIFLLFFYFIFWTFSKVVVKTCSFSYLTLSPDRWLTIDHHLKPFLDAIGQKCGTNAIFCPQQNQESYDYKQLGHLEPKLGQWWIPYCCLKIWIINWLRSIFEVWQNVHH